MIRALLYSLSARLALALAAVFILVGIFFVFLMASMTERYQQETAQKLNRELAGHIVEERLLLQDGQVDKDGLEHIFHMLMVINPAIEVYLLDKSGRILAFDAPEDRVKRKKVNLVPVQTFLDGKVNMPILGDDPRDQGRKKVFSAAPITLNGELQGYLYVILGGESYENIAQMMQESYVMKLNTGVVAAGLVLALLLAILFFAVLTRRLTGLMSAVDTFRMTGQVPLLEAQGPHGDEIEHLRRSFEEMALRINEQMQRLQQTDSLRRELVANVSHDLRTPLALLQSTHLNTLVNELFELAKLDANEVTPECEPFALPELVQDVVHKFQLRADQEDIELVYDIANTAIPFVVADIGLIERVLDNLLDNAIQHTPHGGTVTISLTPGQQHVTVQVRDTGHGIAEHELPYVFDRFYKGARNARNQGGAGLGLAIVQRILELHGSVIEANSQSNIGTAFSFDLPARPAF